MAWEQLTIDKPHLAYMILGGFTSLFMLCSLFVKEKLYIGEATVATICGIIFGPHAANLFNPASWGNVDQITLECSRIVLVVQCFAVGVELPKYYMERHWRSVVLLLVPVMTYGWLVTSLFIWWMIEPLSWLESLCCAACVTATDPVLASSVVGKGKFAKRVPKHLRDLLSAESGCNDGMAFPFIYLSLYLIRYRPHANEVAYYWICFTILYECIFGAVYGVILGYCGRHAIKFAERKGLIDRESLLVFYFTLALFCAGSGSLLGLDDLLVGFAAGVGFSNDGWFQEKTEESHVSNVIDLLLNLAYFVYFGSIVPWDLYNATELGLSPWRLAVIAIFVILFRRIPIMMALKPIIPDIKNWREALFAGHFGPIGVGAIFVAILARAELEHEETTPLAELPAPGSQNYTIVELIWPITTFLVISSILVHGSSIAVFTLGKHIHTLNITMSYTKANEASWMDRLPRIQSRSKSQNKGEFSDMDSSDENMAEFAAPGTLGPTGVPGNFLRRQKTEDNVARRRKWDSGMGPGGPISESAIKPQRRPGGVTPASRAGSTNEKAESSPSSEEEGEAKENGDGTITYHEGDKIITENTDGDVIRQETEGKGQSEEDKMAADPAPESAAEHHENLLHRLNVWKWGRRDSHTHEIAQNAAKQVAQSKRGPALAYQYGNTIIVEDEDGEVVKKFDLPTAPKKAATEKRTGIVQRPQLRERMGTWLGRGPEESTGQPESSQAPAAEEEDDGIRFTAGGRRMSQAQFIQQLQNLNPKARYEAVNDTDASEPVKENLLRRTETNKAAERRGSTRSIEGSQQHDQPKPKEKEPIASAVPEAVEEDEEGEREVPTHSVADDLRMFRGTAAQRRRQAAQEASDDSDDDGTERVPPTKHQTTYLPGGETAAERRRREAAIGSDETAAERRRREEALAGTNDDNDAGEEEFPQSPSGQSARPGIRFAEAPRPRGKEKR